MRYRLQRHDGTDCSATMVPITVLRMVPIQRYRHGINVQIFAIQEKLDNLSQKDKLFCAVQVLKQIEPQLTNGGIGYKGTRLFSPRPIKSVFREKTQKFALDGSLDKEYGKSMKETDNIELRLDLSCVNWHAYEDCYGTSEEKHLIRYIESIYPKLAEKYEDIYLSLIHI